MHELMLENLQGYKTILYDVINNKQNGSDYKVGKTCSLLSYVYLKAYSLSVRHHRRMRVFVKLICILQLCA